MSDPFSCNVGLLYIFLSWQNWTHWVFVMKVLKLFIIAHLYTLLMPWRSTVRIYLDVEVMQKSSSNKYISTPGFRQLVKRVADGIFLWGTPSSLFWMFDRVEPIRTRNFLSEIKSFIKFGSLPFNPMLCRSFMIPYLQIVSYAFSWSNNIAMRCCFCIIVSRMDF